MKILSICCMLLLLCSAAIAAPVLDGVRDGMYGLSIATDPPGDLASPGPGDWNGVAWTDQTAMYAYYEGNTLYVYVDLTNYFYAISTGQIGLTIDTSTPAGGTMDPWGTAITFAQPTLPDYIIRGDIYSSSDGGWTELRMWDGANFDTGSGVNWGGISGSPIGTQIAYADGLGVELAIPEADIGSVGGTLVTLEFFGTQTGGGKGAYDTVPTDDQTTSWDAPTTQTAAAPFLLIPEP
jgi:hypothetical protein